jgi:hypothetical protein
MIAVRVPVRLAACLFAALSLNAAAAPFALQVGDTRVALDAPAGFSDTTAIGSPRLSELAEALTSASSRILLFALTDADLRLFSVGDPPDMKRYAIIATPRELERERVRPEAFGAFVADSLRQMGPAAPAAADYRKHLDAQPGKAALLAELRRDPLAVTLLQGTRVPSPPRASVFADEKPPQYILSTTTLLLVRGKALNLSVYGPYDSPADLDWLRAVTARWVEDLQRLNSRSQ